MSAAELPRLALLVRRVRNRLWRATLLEWLARALWASALTLALGNLCRWWLGLPDIPTLAALAALPLPFALTLALRRRPVAAVAARTADRLAGADALLLSAWHLSATPPPHPAARPVVLARAERALPEWERLVLGPWRAGGHARYATPWLPLAVCLANLPLLGLEVRVQPAVGTAERAAPTAAAEPSPLAAVVEDLRRAGLERPDTDPVPPPRQDGPAAPGLGMGAADRIEAAAIGPDSPVPRGNAQALAAAGSGRDAAGAQPAPAAAAPPPQGAPQPRIDRVAIERRGDPGLAGADGGAPLAADTATGGSAGFTSIPPAELPAGIAADTSDYAPAHRLLIARYLELMRRDAE